MTATDDDPVHGDAACGAHSRSDHGGRDALVTLLVATALFRVTQNMALTTLSLLGREKLGLHAGAIGVVGAVAGLAMAAVTFTVSGRVPPRRAAASAASGMTILVVALVTFALASSFGMLVAAALLLGAAGGLAMPGLINAVVFVAGGRRERAIGLYTITLSLSLALGPVMESVMLSIGNQDVRTPFVLFSFLPALGVLAIAASLRWSRRGRPSPATVIPPRPAGAHPDTGGTRALGADAGTRDPETGTPAPGAGAGTPRAPGSTPDRPSGPWTARWRSGLLGSREGRVALIAQLLYAIPFAGVTVFGALVARIGFGVSPAMAQVAFTVFFVLSFASRGAVTVRSPIARKLPLFWAAASLTAAGLLLLGLGHGLVLLLVAMGVLGIPHGLTFPLALAMAADSTDLAGLPRANATLLGSTNLAAVIVPLVLGAIVPAVGYRGIALVLLAPVAVCAGLLFTQRTPGAVTG